MKNVTIIDKGIKLIFLWAIPEKVTPNHVTIFRFITIPFVIFFLVLENYTILIPLFAISAFSDAIDGAMARTRDRVTEWGKKFDPVADKLLIGSLAAIVITKEISPILAMIIIILEVLIVITAIREMKKYKKTIEAQKSGEKHTKVGSVQWHSQEWVLQGIYLDHATRIISTDTNFLLPLNSF